ncbi:MAG: ribonuclease P protein component 4 [Candidatus Thorarchaeota archaeon]
MRKRSPKKKLKQLAHARIDILWKSAVETATERPEHAKRQMHSARKIAQKVRTKVPRHMSRRVCRKCGAVLIPGRNARFRIRNNRSTHLTMTCFDCGTAKRFPVIREG